jgi:hypothetical protein
VITRKDWRERGALALHRTDASFVIDAVRPADYDRPWLPAPVSRRAQSNAEATAAKPGAARDATPAQHDIEADQ